MQVEQCCLAHGSQRNGMALGPMTSATIAGQVLLGYLHAIHLRMSASDAVDCIIRLTLSINQRIELVMHVPIEYHTTES